MFNQRTLPTLFMIGFSFSQRLALAIYHSLRALPVIGMPAACKLLLTRFAPWTVSIRPRGFSSPVCVRGCSSDSHAFYSIFGLEEYRGHFARSAQRIVDAGANVGYASIWLSHHYPRASVLAIEPEPANFAILEQNIKGYPQITARRAALWPSNDALTLINPEAENWSFQYVPSKADSTTVLNLGEEGNTPHPPSEVRGLTITEVLESQGWDRLDILKIDIEGAERQLFEDGADWLARVDVLLIEIHDGCWQSVVRAIAPWCFDCRIISKGLLEIRLDHCHRSQQSTPTNKPADR